MANRTILIIGENPHVSADLKELVEFLDTPHVVTAMPSDWRERLGNQVLEALLVGPEVSTAAVGNVLSELADIDQSVPVVMVGGCA